MNHECPGPGCTRRVPDHMLACRGHWRKVSIPTKRLVYATWGGGVGAGTIEHTEAMAKAIEEMGR